MAARALVFIVSVLLVYQACSAQPKTFIIRQEDSNFGFSVKKWMVIKEEGRFRQFSGTIQFDPQHLDATKVDIAVETKSVDSRNDGRDSALRSREFFSVDRFPAMTFKSVTARKEGDDTILVEGDLTIRGVTKRISAPVKVLGVHHASREVGTLAGFESTFVINRRDFGVGEGWAIISDDVTIHILVGASTGGRTASR